MLLIWGYARIACNLEILNLIVNPSFELFDCQIIATKVVPAVKERKLAVEQMGFAYTKEKLIGFHDKKAYGNYYVLKK